MVCYPKSFKTTQVQVIGGDYERMHYCDQFWGAVHDSFLDSKPIFFTVEAFFHVSGYVSAQNNRYWSSIDPRETSELPLYDQKIYMICNYCCTHMF
jgi:hypothetical protein